MSQLICCSYELDNINDFKKFNFDLLKLLSINKRKLILQNLIHSFSKEILRKILKFFVTKSFSNKFFFLVFYQSPNVLNSGFLSVFDLIYIGCFIVVKDIVICTS